MICPNCSESIQDGSLFCNHCGRSTAPKAKAGVSVGTLVLIVVITAMIASAGVWLWTQRNPQSTSKVQGDFAKTQSAISPVTSVKPTPVPEYTNEELFKIASNAVVLIEVFDESGEKLGTGSGFVADSNGAIVTNYHVIRGGYTGKVHFQDGATSPINGVSAYDPDRDVAVIRVSDVSVKPLPLGDSEQLQIGNKVVAIGSPMGLQNTISDGLVSGVREHVIQTSAPISPGSSGGPLFNTHGQVVGVAVASLLGGQNLNFVVPINWAKRYLNSTNLTQLQQVARENTVESNLLASTITVPAGQSVTYPINIDRNKMASPELDGTFSSSGGMGGNIRLLLTDGSQVIYDSGRVSSGNIHLPLKPGTYGLVVDNRGSLMFPRNVNANINLRYVK